MPWWSFWEKVSKYLLVAETDKRILQNSLWSDSWQQYHSWKMQMFFCVYVDPSGMSCHVKVWIEGLFQPVWFYFFSWLCAVLLITLELSRVQTGQWHQTRTSFPNLCCRSVSWEVWINCPNKTLLACQSLVGGWSLHKWQNHQINNSTKMLINIDATNGAIIFIFYKEINCQE